MSQPDPVGRLQELLDRLEGARKRLEETEDPERAVDVLRELADLAKEVQVEIERARREEGHADA
jgi:CRISPR/Cas system Type II protein with McrA/HNH and RuvC-like nuclease domain